MEVPEGVDAELLAKVLSNPEMAVLLTSLAKSMQGDIIRIKADRWRAKSLPVLFMRSNQSM